MALNLDPDFALQSRLSFGRHGRYAWAMVAVVVIQSVVFLQTQRGTVADGAALLLSILVFPYAAIQLLAQERGGRLDLRRLTGKSAGRLSFALVAGASWMPLVAALLAYAVAAFLGVMPPFRAAGAMFMAGAAIAVVLVAAPRSAQLDPWMLVTALFLISGAALAAVREWPLARVPIIVLAGGCIAIALPLARRRVQRPPLVRSATSTALRPLVRLATTRLPEFSRALLTAFASSGAALFVLILIPALMILVLSQSAAGESIVVLLYLPVLIPAFQCSAATRMDRSTGALDRLRLSGAAGWSVVTQLALGFSVPFLLGWVVAAGYLIVHSPSDARTFLLPWPAFACLCLGAGLAEGLAGRRMGTYLIPAVFLSLFVAKEQIDAAWWVPALVVWMPMALAAGRLQRAEGPSLEGGTAVAAFAGLAAMLGLIVPGRGLPLMFLAGAMAVASGFLVPDGRPDRHWRPIVLCAIAAALAAGVAEYYFEWIGVRFEMRTAPSGHRYPFTTAGSHALYAVLTGAYTGGGLLLGWLLHNRFGATTIRSLAARASVGVMVWLTLLALDTRWGDRMEDRFFRTGIDLFDALLVALLGLLIVAIMVLLFSGTQTRHDRHRS